MVFICKATIDYYNYTTSHYMGNDYYWTYIGGSNVEMNLLVLPESFQSIIVWNLFFRLVINILPIFLFLLIIRAKIRIVMKMKRKQIIYCLIITYILYSFISMFFRISLYLLHAYLYHPAFFKAYEMSFWGYIKVCFIKTFSTKKGIFIQYILKNFPNWFFISLYMFILKSSNDGTFYIYTTKMLNRINNKIDVDEQKYNYASNFSATLNEEVNNKIENHQAFLVKKLDKEYIIYFDEILAVESDGNYMNLDNGKEIFSLKSTLGDILSKLPNNFKKIHRSRIINLTKVVNITPDSIKKTMTVTLENNKDYAVARSQQQFIKKYFEKISFKI